VGLAGRLVGWIHCYLIVMGGPCLLPRSGYAVPGIPVVQVVVKGSAYESEFARKIEAASAARAA